MTRDPALQQRIDALARSLASLADGDPLMFDACEALMKHAVDQMNAREQAKMKAAAKGRGHRH